MDITSDTLNASKDGVAGGQKTRGRKEQTMSMISDLVERLRTEAKSMGTYGTDYMATLLTRSAYTIEMLSEKAREPKRGEWIDMGDFEQCSVCKGTHLKEFQSYYGKVTWIKTPYCPSCGARMKGADDE